MPIKGNAKKGLKTKALISQLTPNDIAVINHMDIDGVAAMQLVERKVKAVVNALPSLSGRYPNRGPKILFDAGIPIVDNIGRDAFDKIGNLDTIYIDKGILHLNGSYLCDARLLTGEDIEIGMELASSNLITELNKFIENTLDYAKKEKDLIVSPVDIPNISTSLEGRHTLIVTRGNGFREDLKAIRSYIDEMNPVMIGVDGGGDALLDFGYRPHIIIGDMDSVSDKCLGNCDEIIVHAYHDGTCPGLKRIHDLGLDGKIFPFTGTSEDAALVLSYEMGAELIVTLGSHTNMIDFLEKGRSGMASTMLVQMKLGHKIVDAKGVSQLYNSQVKPGHIAALFIAALFPLSIAARASPILKDIYRLVSLRIRMILGI